jgi:hypothetical protein
MKPVKGYYSIIQFCPDRAKFEVANVGLILFAPEINYLDVKVSHSNGKIHHFFGRNNFDVGRLNFLKESIQNRLRVTEKGNIISLDALEKFINTRANEIVLTSPRPVKIEDPQKELESLFDELVGGRAKKQKSRILFPGLDKIFKTRLHDKMQFNQPVKVPGLERVLDIPYAYRNGKLNLIRPQEFGPQGVDTGLRLAAEGKLIQGARVDGIERKLIVLPKIEKLAYVEDMRSSLTGLFREFSVRTVWEDEIDRFAQEVEQQAH